MLQAGIGQPGGRGQVAQVSSVRRPEDALERPGRPAERRLLQQGEDAAPVVVDHDQAQIGDRLARTDDQPGRIMQERQVADERKRGPPPAAWCASAAPIAAEAVPSIPLAPRLARTRIRRGTMWWSRSRMGRLEAAQSKAPSGSAATRSRASRGSVTASSASRMSLAAWPAAASARRQDASQAAPPAPRPARRTAGATSVAVRDGSSQRPGCFATTMCRAAAPRRRRPTCTAGSAGGTGRGGPPR